MLLYDEIILKYEKLCPLLLKELFNPVDLLSFIFIFEIRKTKFLFEYGC
jgi:hypothetical protein